MYIRMSRTRTQARCFHSLSCRSWEISVISSCILSLYLSCKWNPKAFMTYFRVQAVYFERVIEHYLCLYVCAQRSFYFAFMRRAAMSLLKELYGFKRFVCHLSWKFYDLVLEYDFLTNKTELFQISFQPPFADCMSVVGQFWNIHDLLTFILFFFFPSFLLLFFFS